MIVNWPCLGLFLVILLSLSITATISPIIVIKLLMRWPKFIFPKLFQEEELRPTTQKALELIDTNPKEYKKNFWHQLLMIRIGGCVGLLMSLIILVVVVFALLTNT
jgi:hypothetical protein